MVEELKSNLAEIIRSKGKSHFIKVIDDWSKPFLGCNKIDGRDYLDCNPDEDESGTIKIEKILPGKLLYYIFERGFEPTELIKDILIASLYTDLKMGVIYPAENIETEIERVPFDILVASIQDYYPKNAYYFLDITGRAETGQNTTLAKRRGILDWIKRHPHSYGLIGSFVLLTITLVVGLFNAGWRLWCWRTASLAFIVLILSLLGGKSR